MKNELVAIGSGIGRGFVQVDLGMTAGSAGRWKAYVGSAAGSRARKGEVLCTVATREEALKYLARFVQFHNENSKYLERTNNFVKRIGIEKIRQILVEDSNGICARLDAEQERDGKPFPYLSQDSPFHPSHFVEVLEPARRSGTL